MDDSCAMRKCGSWIVHWWSNDLTIVYYIHLHMDVCFDWRMNVSLFIQSNPARFTANERCSDSKLKNARHDFAVEAVASGTFCGVWTA